MASLRVKTAAHRRSGDGRECGLLRQNSINREDSSKSTGRPGHGAQAAAWNASLNFVKSHSPKTTTANNGSSISTSPETDPGASDAFRFFEGELFIPQWRLLVDDGSVPAAAHGLSR